MTNYMKIGISLGALALLAAPAFGQQAAEATAKIGSKIPAFSAQAVSFVDSHAAKVPTAYMVIGVNCGATPGYEKRFKAVEDEFRSKGVDFVWVFPNKTETLEAKQAWMKKVGLKGAMIEDTGAKIATALDCKQTAQVVFADKEGNIVFKGGIDDSKDEAGVKRRHLAEAIKDVLAGKPVSVSNAKAFG